MNTHITKVAALLLVVLLPVASTHAASSTNFQITPADDTISNSHDISSTNFLLNGSLDPMGSLSTSTSFSVQGGPQFGEVCGDGFVDPGEDCEGTDLNGGTCSSEGFDSGSLSCNSSCAYVTSSCESDSDGGGGGGGGGGSSSSSSSSGSAPSSPSLSSGVETVEDDGEDVVVSFDNTVTLYGSRAAGTTIEINGSSEGVTYPTSTSWQATVTLDDGENDVEIVAVSSTGVESEPTTVVVDQREVGDVNDDNRIDDYDLSLLVRSWNSDDPESDFNEDGEIDDYDFSLFVSRWV